MPEADADEAIEVQEETDDEGDDVEEEPPIEIQEPATTEANTGAETRTIHPFYSTRGEADGSVRVRAGWRFEDGGVHSLPIDNAVPIDLAQMAEDLARNWHQRQLNVIAQQREAAAQRQQQDEGADGDE